MTDTPTRRAVLGAGVFAAGSWLAIDRSAAQAPLALTPACHDGDEATPRQTEGPFFKPSSPERIELYEAGMAGQPIELVGFVLSRGCKPHAGALLDFWQADDKGRYDNSGFRLRGHQFTDAEGPLSIAQHRARRLSRPHAAHPSEGAAARRPCADHPALFPRRVPKPFRRIVSQRTIDPHRQERGMARRPF